MDRRGVLLGGVALAAFWTSGPGVAETRVFEVTRSDREWRAMLSDTEYKVMRREGTERAGSSPLDRNYAPGIYHCRGCDLALYSSEHKFDSGTGWPSFWQSLPHAVGTKPDRKLFRVP